MVCVGCVTSVTDVYLVVGLLLPRRTPSRHLIAAVFFH